MEKVGVLFTAFFLMLSANSSTFACESKCHCSVLRPTNFTLNGSAQVTRSSPYPVLRLTDELGQAGSAFLTESVDIKRGFNTSFAFQITDPEGISDMDGQGADGITFVIQSLSETALGDAGGGIGYQNIGSNSLAVEFDSWYNPDNGDIDGNHVGINLNGSMTSVVSKSIPPILINAVSARLNNGAVWFAWIDYDGRQLQVRLSPTCDRPEKALLKYRISSDKLSTLLGGNTDVFIGFTSGTGSAAGNHDILCWNVKVKHGHR